MGSVLEEYGWVRRGLVWKCLTPERLPDDLPVSEQRGSFRVLAPCGTPAARARHRRADEGCSVCGFVPRVSKTGGAA